MFVLFNIIFSMIASILDSIFGFMSLFERAGLHSSGLISSIYSLAVTIPAIAVTVRRFHDIGKSGWVYFRFLIAFVVAFLLVFGFLAFKIVDIGGLENMEKPGTFILAIISFFIFIVGISIWLIVLLAKEGDRGENKYGPDPKAEDMIDGVEI